MIRKSVLAASAAFSLAAAAPAWDAPVCKDVVETFYAPPVWVPVPTQKVVEGYKYVNGEGGSPVLGADSWSGWTGKGGQNDFGAGKWGQADVPDDYGHSGSWNPWSESGSWDSGSYGSGSWDHNLAKGGDPWQEWVVTTTIHINPHPSIWGGQGDWKYYPATITSTPGATSLVYGNGPGAWEVWQSASTGANGAVTTVTYTATTTATATISATGTTSGGNTVDPGSITTTSSTTTTTSGGNGVDPASTTSSSTTSTTSGSTTSTSTTSGTNSVNPVSTSTSSSTTSTTSGSTTSTTSGSTTTSTSTSSGSTTTSTTSGTNTDSATLTSTTSSTTSTTSTTSGSTTTSSTTSDTVTVSLTSTTTSSTTSSTTSTTSTTSGSTTTSTSTTSSTSTSTTSGSTTSSTTTSSGTITTTTTATFTSTTASTTSSSTTASTTATGACATVTGTYVLQGANTGDFAVDGNYLQLRSAFGSGYTAEFSANRQNAQQFKIQPDCSLTTADGNLLAMIGAQANLHTQYFFPSVQAASALVNVNWEADVCQMNADNTLSCTAMGQSIFQVTPGTQGLQLGDANYGEAVTINMIPVPGTVFRA